MLNNSSLKIYFTRVIISHLVNKVLAASLEGGGFVLVLLVCSLEWLRLSPELDDASVQYFCG